MSLEFANIPERDAIENLEHDAMLSWVNVRRFLIDEYVSGTSDKVYCCMLGEFCYRGKHYTMYQDGYVPVDGWVD